MSKLALQTISLLALPLLATGFTAVAPRGLVRQRATPTALFTRRHSNLKSSLDLDGEDFTVSSVPLCPPDGDEDGCGCTGDRNRHSARDWLYNVRTMPQSSVMREIKNPVLSVTGWATAVSIVHRCFQWGGRSGMASSMCLSSSPHSYLISSLGLLLVFKTNAAYNRFTEGRKIWEEILSISRNLSRFMNLYEKDIGKARVQRVKQLMAAFPYLLRQHIRPRCLDMERVPELIASGYGLPLKEPVSVPLETRFEGDKDRLGVAASSGTVQTYRDCWVDRRTLPWRLLPSKILDNISVAENRPLWVCDNMAKELVAVKYSDNYTSRERLTLVNQVEKLTTAIGACERIHQTSVPLNYARHSLRSLTLWLFTLPFAMIKDLGLLTGPIMGIIAWLMFGVYQIGYSIEDPFQGSLRLSILCDNIRRDILGGEERNCRETAFGKYDWEDGDDKFESASNIEKFEIALARAPLPMLRESLRIRDEQRKVEEEQDVYLTEMNSTGGDGNWM